MSSFDKKLSFSRDLFIRNGQEIDFNCFNWHFNELYTLFYIQKRLIWGLRLNSFKRYVLKLPVIAFQ